MRDLSTPIVKSKATLLHKLSLAILLLLGVFSVFSPLRALQNFNQIWAICVVGWYFVNILYTPKFLTRPSFYNYAIYFFVAYTLILPYLTGNSKIGNRFFEISQVFLFYLAYSKNRFIGRSKDNIFIIKIIALFAIFTSIMTIYAYQSNPYISRAVKAGTEEGNQALSQGVGGYEFVYAIVIILPVLLVLLLQKKYIMNIKSKIILFIIGCLFAINIILSNYSIAFILLILSTIMIILIRKLNIAWISVYISIIVVLLFLNISYLASGLFGLFSDFFGDTMNASRMAELNQLFAKNEVGNSLEARSYTYNRSLEAFLESPIFGDVNKELSTNIGLTGFGQHSQILDCFALFGFFIGILQLYLFCKPFIIRMRTTDATLKKLSFIILTIFVLLIFFNNITPSIGFAAFFVFPTAYDWIKERRITQKTDFMSIGNRIKHRKMEFKSFEKSK